MTRAAAAILLAVVAAGCASGTSLPPSLFLSGGEPIEEGYSSSGAARRRWEDIDRVHTTLMPYAWRASARGDAVVRDVPVDFDEGDDLENSFGGRIEIYSERVGFFLDGFYTTVSHQEPSVEYDERTMVLDLGTAMRVLGGDPWQGFGDRPPVDFELDGLALIRTHFLKMDATPAGAFESASDDEVWADLVFGMRGAVVLLGRLSLFGKIDGGGMALDQWHSWTWSAETGAKLRITKNLGAVLAYRWYGSHFEDDTPEAVATPFGTTFVDTSRDIRLEGVWVGIVLEF